MGFLKCFILYNAIVHVKMKSVAEHTNYARRTFSRTPKSATFNVLTTIYD